MCPESRKALLKAELLQGDRLGSSEIIHPTKRNDCQVSRNGVGATGLSDDNEGGRRQTKLFHVFEPFTDS